MSDHRYPNSPGYAAGSQTSKDAADQLSSKANMVNCILDAIRQQGNCGLTVDEAKIIIEERLGKEFDRSTVAARFTELDQTDWIAKTDQTRISARGRAASVYVHGIFSVSKAPEKPEIKPKSDPTRAMAEIMYRTIKRNQDSEGYASATFMPLDMSVLDRLAQEAGI